MLDGKVIGTVTSGNCGHRAGLNILHAFVESALAEAGTAFVIDILGIMVPAKVIPAGSGPGSG